MYIHLLRCKKIPDSLFPQLSALSKKWPVSTEHNRATRRRQRVVSCRQRNSPVSFMAMCGPAVTWVQPGLRFLSTPLTSGFGGYSSAGGPSDIRVSNNGADWQQVSNSPWNNQPGKRSSASQIVSEFIFSIRLNADCLAGVFSVHQRKGG